VTEFDVLIVGAGIAGCATALELRSRGWRVGVLHQPQHACSFESLSPGAVRVLREWSIDAGCDISDVVAWWGSDQEKHAAHPGARVAQRNILADSLRKRTIEQGAVVYGSGSVLHTERVLDLWRIEYEAEGARDPRLRSRFLVDATGRRAVVGRRLGAERLTLDQLFCISADIDEPKIVGSWTESEPNGWWNLCCSLEGGTLSFYSKTPMIRESRSEIAAYFNETKHLRYLLPGPRLLNPYVRSCGSSRLAPCAGPGWFSVGDAAWTVQPLASGGVSKALRDARLVAQILEQGTNYYDRFQTAEFTSYLGQLAQQYALEKRWTTSPFWKIPNQVN